MILDLYISGAKLIFPEIFQDDRGFFFESYNQEKYKEAGINVNFVQDNHSKSVKNTLRGLHYQSEPGQAKLLRVISGTIYDVIVDIRPNSKTYKKWFSVTLDAQSHQQIFIPVGCAHGFYVLSDTAEVCYKVSSLYDSKTECSLKWNDPDIGVVWPAPCINPLLSERDKNAESFAEYKERI